MTEIIGIRFRTAGKIYYFAPAGIEVKRGSGVIVETSRGVEMGTVVVPPSLVEDDKIVQPLRPILRAATQEDLAQAAANKAKEKNAYRVCQEKILKHGLEMKLIDAEYTFDGSKLLFYFTADGRIDFRELVKELASVFRTRIELRQIGVRDETKILGGIGICGRVLCCHSYLSDFVPVSIKMAKEQNLSLNPTKISGTCGRLMCCLKNEEDIYEELNRKLPALNDHVTTADGLTGQVQSVNVLRQTVRILVEKGDEKEMLEYPVEELTFRPRKSKKEKQEEREAAGKGEKSGKSGEEKPRRRKNHQGGGQAKAEGAPAQEGRPEDGDQKKENRQGGGHRRHRNNHRREKNDGEGQRTPSGE